MVGREGELAGAAPLAPGDQSVFLGSGAGEGTLELLMLTIRLLVREMSEPRKCGRHYRPREFRTWGSNPESIKPQGWQTLDLKKVGISVQKRNNLSVFC